MAGTIRLTSSVKGTVRVRIRPDVELAHRLESLERAVTGIWGELDDIRAQHEQDMTKVRERVDGIAADLANPRGTVEDRYRDAQNLNARGFPLAAIGAVLAGVPVAFVSWWWVLLFGPLSWVAVTAVRTTARHTWSEIARGATRYPRSKPAGGPTPPTIS